MADDVKKLSMRSGADGSVSFLFGSDPEPVVVRAEDYPEKVRDAFLHLGLKTAHRNATIGSEDKGSVGSPAEMKQRMLAKIAAWRAGVLRIAVDSGERLVPLLILESAVIYKAMKASVAAGKGIPDWASFVGDLTPESVRADVEALAEVTTNPEAVEAARAKAQAEGKDAEAQDAAAEKARVTRLDQLLATDLFKLARAEATKAREARKAQALMAKLAAQPSDAAPL